MNFVQKWFSLFTEKYLGYLTLEIGKLKEWGGGPSKRGVGTC